MKTAQKVIAVFTALGLSATLASCADDSTQSGNADGEFFTTDQIHSISVDFSDEDYQAMLDTYSDSGTKEWIEATVTIDGTVFENAGIKLKGNSSLQGLRGNGGGQSTDSAQSGEDNATNESENVAQSGTEQGDGRGQMMGGNNEGDGSVDAESPQTLPWVIRLDKYVDGQSYDGRSRFVVRGNNTETSLNEAVALAMLNEAGVPAQQAAFTSFSVNGSDQKLRLVLDVPDDDAWNVDTFGDSGYTYKADSEGDYSYRGDDAASYADAFEQKYGETNMTPLIDFLDFINNSTDEEFESDLDSYLDTEAFAKYLAVQDLIGNEDDIDGMGNNSYLHYDPETGQMTVVAWDHNLAFNGMANMGGGFGADMGEAMSGDFQFPADGEMPEMPTDMGQSGDMAGGPGMGGGERPTGQGGPGGQGGDMSDMSEMQSGDMPEFTGGPNGDTENGGGFGGGGMGGDNVLVNRFEASETFASMYDQQLESLTASLIDSGFAQGVLDDYVTLLTEQASDLVSAESIEEDAAQIEAVLNTDEADSTPGMQSQSEDADSA